MAWPSSQVSIQFSLSTVTKSRQTNCPGAISDSPPVQYSAVFPVTGRGTWACPLLQVTAQGSYNQQSRSAPSQSLLSFPWASSCSTLQSFFSTTPLGKPLPSGTGSQGFCCPLGFFLLSSLGLKSDCNPLLSHPGFIQAPTYSCPDGIFNPWPNCQSNLILPPGAAC